EHLSEKIHKTSRDVIESLSEIVWTVNPKNDSLLNLLSYIRHYAGKYFDATSISNTVEISWKDEEQKKNEINPEVKRNLLMIVKEALNNIVKHSGATSCIINILVDESALHLVVKDDGNGLPVPVESSTGNGLKNMKKRTEEIHGEFTFHSDGISGTIISVRIPLT
ncbi:MAG: ATP-binding protein, partial [Nitrospirota bacterium]|nr:ATP-binding protein [Nitrospirota bacterium]